MNETDRQKIMSNLNDLSRIIPYNSFRQKCLQGQLINETMIREIEKHDENEDTKMIRLLTKVTKRGPGAYQKFKEICWNNFQDAIRVLEPTYVNIGEEHSAGNSMTNKMPEMNFPGQTSPNSVPVLVPNGSIVPIPLPSVRDLELKPYEEEVEPNPKLPPFVFSNRIHYHPMGISVYEMRTKNRGVLFFVNLINFSGKDVETRNGADMDKHNLIWVFRQMGFTVFYYEDIVYKELNRLLEQLVESDHLRRTDCFVFAIMTHGSNDNGMDYVQFPDGGHVKLEEITSKFYNDNCERLRNKPKVFILPFCRGNKPDRGVFVQRVHQTETDGLRNVPTKSDMIFCYGTVKGFETHRDVKDGSWFVQVLCAVFAKHAHNTDLEVMLKMVMGRLITEYRTEDYQLQTPNIDSWGFRCALFFNPGFYLS